MNQVSSVFACGLRGRASRLLAFIALGLSALLSACGGASDDRPAVTSLSATPVQYSRTMSITVNGRNLGQGITLRMEGGCGEVFPVASYSDDVRQFTCSVDALGRLVARVHDAQDDKELGSLELFVPLPQVEVSVAQGTWSGKMLLELDPVAAPVTVRNFLNYVNTGFYRNTLFHRVVSGFVVQAGGYTAGPVLKAPTLPAIALESNNGLRNLRGTVAMARTAAPDSATSQWYVNLVDNSTLDYVDAANPGYAVFGKVVTGLDTVDTIAAVPVQANAATGLTHLPVTNVVITLASQVR